MTTSSARMSGANAPYSSLQTCRFTSYLLSAFGNLVKNHLELRTHTFEFNVRTYLRMSKGCAVYTTSTPHNTSGTLLRTHVCIHTMFFPLKHSSHSTELHLSCHQSNSPATANEPLHASVHLPMGVFPHITPTQTQTPTDTHTHTPRY